MDSLSQIKTFLIIAFLIFICFVGIILYLLVKLLVNRYDLRKAQEQLEEYSEHLKEMVDIRTRELKASEQKYRELFINAKEAILICDRRTNEIIDVNDEVVSLFGYSRDELLSMKFSDLRVFDILGSKQQEWKEQAIKHRDKTRRYLDCVIGGIVYDGVDCHQIICRDVTDKRKLEAQLMQAQKMASLGQLAAGVAHELNTPLGTIYSSCYYIKDFLHKKPEKIPKHVEIVSTHIERCRKIINDLLNFSRAPSATIELEKSNLNELVERCLSLIGKEIRSGGISLNKDLQKIPECLIDPARISQVILNITLNAVQAMPSGGQLTIMSWHDLESDNLPTPLNGSGFNHISIADTGVGIDEGDLPEIFTPFFSTKKANGGIGLGLSVAYEIAESHMGNIQVDSEKGVGTKFQINLPVDR
ncbi:hypothetical protein CEE37_12335 [candidate division LCP-89 bacterium B3_LCP]|uniref:histidine kinase n=1 Tax=candidate division LCP-89 bacterium B3_LCP TaxID=2012998 RepID=A0A532UUV8_UNCL8|nr:MAG: hypothetical protein CEE37_12335 [candidate division LCP-89 bacterium B3_LCP]